MTKNAGKAAIRCNALTLEQLKVQEKHGKRLDKLSQLRRVRKVSPITYGSLHLCDRYTSHMKGVKQNAKALKPVLHFIVRFPPQLLEGEGVGRFSGQKSNRQKMMLRQAVAFINDTHGGEAVFAARIDRDEEGETICDVFASPVYEKRTKRTPPGQPGTRWASATKFGKELAAKHQDEIRRRHPDAKPGMLSSPRMVGIALQSEFADWFRRKNGVELAPKQPKETFRPDRLEKEAWEEIEGDRIKLEREREEVARDRRVVSALLLRLRGGLPSLLKFIKRPDITGIERMDAARLAKHVVTLVDDAEDVINVDHRAPGCEKTSTKQYDSPETPSL